MSVDLFRKYKLAGAFALLSLTMPCSSLFAHGQGQAYIGVFGGGGGAVKTHVTQSGFAFNMPDPRDALLVDATGQSGDFGSAMAGGHFGYEFKLGKYVRPALEFEGFYLRSCGGEKTSSLFNPTFFEHDFVDKLPLRNVSFFGNFIFAVQLPWKWLEPYVGGGIGGAIVWIEKAHSQQDSPAEPGINHFNSKPTASDSAFTAQLKTGLRFNIHRHWRIFAEYRYLYLASTTYIFGFTEYSTHAPTSNWILDLGKLDYNLGVLGLEYKF